MTQCNFKTEISQLLNLVIHSLYSNKDIFLRELISNASDAIDRARFESISNQDLLGTDTAWKIKIIPNKEAKTLTLCDNGIGMNEEEVEKNIGTIASSGTRRFLEEMKNSNANGPDLIGQFGVGFYAAFMVADNVQLITRRIDAPADEAVSWSSTGEGTYNIEKTTKESRGTTIILHLREECEEYLDNWKIEKIVKKFSDFVEHPIYMDFTTKEENGDEKTEERIINSQKAIWQQSPSEIKEEDYTEFYKHIGHDWQPPLETLHWNVEGTSEFRSLIFIPKASPFDMFSPDNRHKHGIQLYVRRVFITDDCEALAPTYMRFLRGVVDSNDLPLNVSRELLQEDRQIRVIRKNIVKKVLDTLKKMKENETEKYITFWKEFGATLKEGIHLDFENQEKIRDLMIFKTNKTNDDEWISLADYVTRMPESQQDIYYVSGESVESIENSPHLEAFNAKNLEVLYMTDPIDDWVLQSITQYNDKKMKSIEKGDINLDTEAEKEEKEKQFSESSKTYEELLTAIKNSLGDSVKEVRLSKRLTDSACCLVGNENDMGTQMEKILRAMKQEVGTTPKRILELNPNHPALVKLQSIFAGDHDDPRIAEYAALFFDQALLTAGLPIKDPLLFTKRISSLMAGN